MTERTIVTLATGEAVDSWDPAWKAECLKRHVVVLALLRVNGLDARRAKLAAIEEEHGALFRSRVQDELAAAWAEQRKAKEVVSG